MSPAVQNKYGITGVRFSNDGFPDFSPFALDKQVLPKFTNRTADFAAAAKLAGIDVGFKQSLGLSWHHAEDGVSMYLVPNDIHNAVKHTGGFAISHP